MIADSKCNLEVAKAQGLEQPSGTCCKTSNICGQDEGDCDKDEECADGLYCGNNNCPGMGSSHDCCTAKGMNFHFHPNTFCLDVVKDKVVQEIQNWGKVYTVEFEITIINSGEGWINVFHITAGNADNSNYGDRIPAMFIKKYSNSEAGYFHIASSINGNKDVDWEYEYELGKRYKITIKQFKDKNYKYWYEIVIDGESKFKIENTVPESFSNVKLYASDPWYSAFSSARGSICNFKIQRDDEG